MSRAEATAAAHLARSAAGAAAEELRTLGLLEINESRAEAGRLGRPSPGLSLRPGSATVLAGALHPDAVELAIVDLNRTIMHRETIDLAIPALPPDQAIPAVARHLNALLGSSAAAKCTAIGISLPGMISDSDGIARAVLPLAWREVPVGELLAARLRTDLPIHLGHDATFGALAEFRAGAGRGAHRMLFLTSQQVGVGSALITSAHLGGHLGHTLQAGHLIVDPTGPACSCGSHGCLELFVDGRAIAAALRLPPTTSAAELHRALQSGILEDRPARPLAEVLDALSVGLISLVNTLGPDRVVLAGLLAPLARAWRRQLEEALGRSVVAQVEPVSLRVATLDDAVLLGVAERAFTPLMHDPVRTLSQG
ncbi:ROK family protein [Nonomuraea spiralis]|uniref:ROK family protein n=1 Tax=Nonomuraea spiralis TaxID=46182 RepID=A0ABV5IUN4_9ACTN|nr:ROK family protein [Nonomuraea spiralis]GGT17369.1 hypothetical protein GCM10010176_072510 [Nonomuraea spiralis]